MAKALSNVSGFPRIGAQRELKLATEGFWSGQRSQRRAPRHRARRSVPANWKLQRDAGIDLIPSNDFSLLRPGARHDRARRRGPGALRLGRLGDVDLDTYFAMARGRQGGGVDVTAMEMTKWFDTNYHYIVPELERGMSFRLSSRKPFDEYQEAKELGIETKPVLIGPLTFLLQGKCAGEEFDRLELLDSLVEVYAEVLARARPARRRVGADRRAGAGRGPLAPPSSRRSSAPTGGLARSRARRRSSSTRTSTTSARRFPCSRGCRSPAIGLDFVRGRAEPGARSPGTAGPRARRSSPASSPVATSGSTTSTRSLALLRELDEATGGRGRRLDLLLAAALADRQAQRAAASTTRS